MSDHKAEVLETTALPSPTRASPGSRVGRHYKKWWWAHLIFFIIVVLVVTLPVVYVAYPKIARRDVNRSTLNITSMVISDPTPDSFQLDQSQTIGSHSSYHPEIYAFDAAVSLLGAASAFATVKIPKVKSKNGAVVNISQSLDLSNETAFGGFATAIMLQEEVELNIYGKPELKEGGLPKVTVTYDKTVTMKGLNKLDGFNVTEFQILTTPVNGRNMNGTVFIPNPSVMTIHMGNVTLNLYANNTAMGYTYLDNLILEPGNNFIPMTATVEEIAIANLILSDNTPYTDGVVPFEVTGNSSVYNGKELAYFTEALSSNNLTIHLNVSQAIASLASSL